MKTLSVCLVTVSIILTLLRSGLTPFRIMTKGELDAVSAAAALAAQKSVPPAKPGAWMFDPNYRTALDRTTIVNTSEGVHQRESNPRR